MHSKSEVNKCYLAFYVVYLCLGAASASKVFAQPVAHFVTQYVLIDELFTAQYKPFDYIDTGLVGGIVGAILAGVLVL